MEILLMIESISSAKVRLGFYDIFHMERSGFLYIIDMERSRSGILISTFH